jgi:hypothetical protein
MTGQRVAAILKAAIIPLLGPNKLSIVGRGNPHVREDGTAVRIFNVQAFGSLEDATEAKQHFDAGYAIEKSGDIAGAQEHYKNALNKLMSFSVLEQNAADFSASYQVTGRVEEVETRAGGTKLGINNPRAVIVGTSGASVSHMFELPEDVKNVETLAPDAKTIIKPSLDSLKQNRDKSITNDTK